MGSISTIAPPSSEAPQRMGEGEQLHLPPRRRWHLRSATFRSALRLFSLLPPLPPSPLSSPNETADSPKQEVAMEDESRLMELQIDLQSCLDGDLLPENSPIVRGVEQPASDSVLSEDGEMRAGSIESIQKDGLADHAVNGEVEEGQIVEDRGDSSNPPFTGGDVGVEKVLEKPSSLYLVESENRAISQCDLVEKLGRSGEGQLLDYGDLYPSEEGKVRDHSFAPSVKKERNNAKKSKSKPLEHMDGPISEESSGKLLDSSNEKKTKSKDVDFAGKKKRILTEERKAKKKLAKKRKRAETNRKLGVKKLKIMPVSVPKKVVYCDFYLKGRCQQGSSCKYSHDTTPLTKSQPCKHFACNSCLKGDECPYDHDLGKYPCHNFMGKGFCRRGETCKFSHKISSAENSADGISKQNSLLPTKDPISSNHLTKNVPAQSGVSDVTRRAMLEPLTSTYKSKMGQKSPLKAPKGICFLSFGNSQSIDADKPQIVPHSNVGHAIGMPGHQNNVESSILQRSSNISFATPLSVCPPSLQKQNTSISMGSRASVQSTLETAPARAANSPIPGFLPGKTSGKGIANVCIGLCPVTAANGETAHSKATVEAARLLDEFLFHGST